MSTCGDCAFRFINPKDVTQGECHGVPPSLVVLPIPGGAQIVCQGPIVPAGRPACAYWKSKLIVPA